MSNRSVCKTWVFVLIFLYECACHMGELEFVVLRQVHTVTVFDRSDIMLHHQRKHSSLFSRLLVDFSQLFEAYASFGQLMLIGGNLRLR